MSRAISFGVFCRSAPSTSLIIRSRKVEPGSEVISTTIRSERTFVPPVTAERSPPASRMTGADSPVMADSSTEAIPSTTVPSPGISWFASTTTRSPLRSVEAGTLSSRRSGPTRRRATASVFVRRSASAWAFPRPSATASAKFAKRTVAQSQRTTWSWKENDPRVPTPRRASVARTAPASTTNITGFLAMWRGWSLRKESAAARVRRARSRSWISECFVIGSRLRTSGPRPSGGARRPGRGRGRGRR